jgi:hypothetical protein
MMETNPPWKSQPETDRDDEFLAHATTRKLTSNSWNS